MARTGLWMAALMVFSIIAYLATVEGPTLVPEAPHPATPEEAPCEKARLLGAYRVESAPTLLDQASGRQAELVVQRISLPVIERLAQPMRFAPGSSTWTLLVLDDATDEPVAGAEILASSFGWGGTADYLDPGYFGPDHKDFLRDYAVFTLTDADGKAEIPRFFHNVLARKSGASGSHYRSTCGNGRRRQGEFPTIRLSPDLLQEVLVTDDLGNPVSGARVGIAMKPGSKAGSRILGCTDQNGRTTITLDRRPRMILAEGGSLFVQTMGVPPVAHTPQHADNLPEELHLKLPPAHKIILEILDPLGLPYTEAVLLDFSSRNHGNRERAEGGALGGRYVLPAVGPGSEIFVRVASWDSNLLGHVDPVLMPTGQTGTFTFRVQMEWITCTIRGRLLDDAGKPLANQRADIVCDAYFLEEDGSRKGNPQRFALETDAEGRFFGPSGDLFLFLDGWEGLGIRVAQENGTFLQIDLPDASASEPGPRDLGDLRLQPYP